MRKIISLVLVAAMLVTMMVFAPTASAATLDAGNMQIDAQYFGGTLMFDEIGGGGTEGPFTWAGAYEVKAGNPDLGTLTIDGKIGENEWTNVVYHIDSDYAPESGLAYGNNSLFEVPSAENTFYRWLKDGNNKSLAPKDGLEYDVRFMWDEDFFYMAVEYLDADGQINGKTATDGDNWDGDSIQFRLDPAGPNAVVGGTGYDASVDSFPYNPSIHGDTDNTPNCTYPWSNENNEYFGNYNRARDTIGDFIFSYSDSGYTDMCDGSKRYNPQVVTEEVDNGDGTVSTNTYTKYNHADIYMDLSETDKMTYAAAYYVDQDPRPAFNLDKMTFEIALPWAIVADDYTPEANAELGFSMTRFNAKKGIGTYNSYLSWGSGVTNYETRDMPQVCGGSNCLVLNETQAKETVAHEHVFAAPTCITPEKCECGYERGFVAGHKYAFSNESLPSGSGDGSISGVCTICGDAFDKTIASNSAYTRWDFLETETTISDQGWWAEGGFCIQWEDLDPNGSRYTDETDPTGTLRVKWWNEDGTAKNSFDNKTFAAENKNVLDLTSDGQVGTYFEASSYASSYTEATDVYFTNLPLTSTIDSENPYNTFFGNWFGGDGTYGGGTGIYALAGLVNVEDQWFFAIYPASHQNPQTLEDFYSVAYSYTPATPEQIALNTWHEYAFMFDNASETAMLLWDGKLVASASDYHFRCNGTGAILLQHNAQSYITNLEVGSTGLAKARTGWQGNVATSTYKVTVDGTEYEYEAGATVEISARQFFKDDGQFVYSRFFQWTGDVDVLDDITSSTVSFTMPEKDIVLDSSYVGIGDLNQDGKCNSMDGNLAKRVFTASVAKTDYIVAAGDINYDASFNAQDSNLLARIAVGELTPSK